jgi:anti-sigma regulatory factor (Ser/Thr protein kinase)
VINGASEPPTQAAPAPRRLQLELTGVPADVARARHAVGRFALDAGLDYLEIGAVELAVGEACANVVRHAYGSSAGAMIVDATADGERMQVSVRDDGAGIRRRISGGRTGLGTAIMIALCDTLEVGSGPDGAGTRVTMTFAL